MSTTTGAIRITNDFLRDAPSDGSQYARKDGAWVVVSGSGGTSNHGSLTGLGDDDHTQYLLATGARAGASSQAQDFGTNGIKTDAIIPHSTTGIQLGTSATQKVALFGATPVVQQDHVAHATGTSDILARLNELIDAVEAVGITATS